MLNFDGTSYEIDFTTYVAIYILLTIAVTAIQFFSKTMLLDWHSKKKRTDIIKAFRNNRRIRPHIEEYEKIKWINLDSKGFVYTNIGFLCGFIFPCIMVMIITGVYENIYHIDITDTFALKVMIYTINISFFVPLVCLFYTALSIKKAFNDKILLQKHVTYAITLTAISYYTVTAFLINLLFMVVILYNWKMVTNSTSTTQFLSMSSFLMVAATIFMIVAANKSFKNSIKNFINMEKVSSFPIMKITTKENTVIEGVVLDIFDDKVLILKDKGIEKIITWDSVHIIEIDNRIREEHENQMHLDNFSE